MLSIVGWSARTRWRALGGAQRAVDLDWQRRHLNRERVEPVDHGKNVVSEAAHELKVVLGGNEVRVHEVR